MQLGASMALRWVLLAALVAATSALLFGLSGSDDPAFAWQLASRYTARISVLVFLPVYVASSMVALWPMPSTRALLRNRRNLGLGFAMAHTIHLYALIRQLLAADGIHPEELAGGIVIYALIFAMAVTSFPWAYRALGKNWKRLHKLGIHAIWIAFFLAYSGRIFEPEARVIGVAFTALLVAAMFLRIAAYGAKRKRRVAA